jgi:UPF0755 protein
MENPDKARRIQPGFYALRQRMSAQGAFDLLLDPSSRIGRVIIPEGMRTSDVLQRISERSRLSLSDLKAAAANPATLGVPASVANAARAGSVVPGSVPGTQVLEGYLAPGAYDVGDSTSAKAVLQEMVRRRMEALNRLEAEIGQSAEAARLTPYQVLIVASLIEGESQPQDFGKVARVIYNHLNSPLPHERFLRFDSTVNYALGRPTTLAVSYDDITVGSPYNTYQRPGLPIGPIANPSDAALKAALNPEPGEWMYFITVDPRTAETRFTKDYAEFEKWKAEFNKNMAELPNLDTGPRSGG